MTSSSRRIVAFHNVWSGLPMVLTIMGWAQVTKALLYFAAPEIGMRGMSCVSLERRKEFIMLGLVSTVLGLAMLHLVMR